VRLPIAVSPTGETIYGVEIALVSASRGPNAIGLAYTTRAAVIVGGSKCDN